MYPKPDTLEEAFEFINTIAVPRRGHRPVFYQNHKGGRGRHANSRAGRGPKDSQTVSQTKLKGKKGPSAENPCMICALHTHWAKECPNKNEEGGKKEEDENGNNEQATQLRRYYLAIPHDIMDKDDEQTLYAPRLGQFADSATDQIGDKSKRVSSTERAARR